MHAAPDAWPSCIKRVRTRGRPSGLGPASKPAHPTAAVTRERSTGPIQRPAAAARHSAFENSAPPAGLARPASPTRTVSRRAGRRPALARHCPTHPPMSMPASATARRKAATPGSLLVPNPPATTTGIAA
eukprot:scaffold4779_cov116-Isochrysis_galbana.AAC.22